MSRPWTEAHRREALRRTYEIAAELATGRPDVARYLVGYTGGSDTEAEWRALLSSITFAAARINREVRRARGLAEGRLEREEETVWRILDEHGVSVWEGKGRPGESDVRAPWTRARVHVTRIRRAR